VALFAGEVMVIADDAPTLIVRGGRRHPWWRELANQVFDERLRAGLREEGRKAGG
jgi:hypothetical protein